MFDFAGGYIREKFITPVWNFLFSYNCSQCCVYSCNYDTLEVHIKNLRV